MRFIVALFGILISQKGVAVLPGYSGLSKT